MEEFKTDYIEDLANGLSNAVSPSEMLESWLPIAKKYKNLRVMSCLSDYRRSSVPLSISQLPQNVKQHLISYLDHDKIYFMSDDIIEGMLQKKDIKIPIDYSVCFDTNFSSYIGTIIRGGDLKENHDKVITILDAIIYNDINFDHLFYLAENIKQTRKIISNNTFDSIDAKGFWMKLNRDFRWNLVALELFRGVDCKHYKKTSIPTSQFSFRQAFKNSMKNTFNFYASKQGRKFCNHIIETQRVILLLLIKILNIQFKSKKKERAKLLELLTFMHGCLGIYFDREAMIACLYFMDRKLVPFLQVINQGGSQIRLLKKLDNLAWDLVSVRFIEKIMSTRGEGQFLIPYFLTLDSKLVHLYELYKVKAVIFDDDNGMIIPIPSINSAEFLEKNNLMKMSEYFFSNSAKNKRAERSKPNEIQTFTMIKTEYKNLRSSLLKSKK